MITTTPTPVRSVAAIAALACALAAALASRPAPIAGAAAAAIEVETLRSVGGLPAHIAGRFNPLSICRQTLDGGFLIFDRRSQTVFGVDRGADAPREIIRIGAEPGRIIQPYAFDVAPDGSFVVADAPENRSRVQVFLESGARVAGFSIAGRGTPLVMDGLVITGLGSLILSSNAVLVSQPESGSLVTERGLDGVSARTFGELRATGHEQDPPLHHALNSGLVVLNPEGGFYYVFAAGRPMFRKYDSAGALVFERHIEGIELDEYMQNRPTVWPRRKTEDGEAPVVRPAIRAAAADASGSLWISLDPPFTYVYDRRGDKVRVVQLRAAGVLAPTSMSFTPGNRLLASPGCFLFDPQAESGPRRPGRGGNDRP